MAPKPRSALILIPVWLLVGLATVISIAVTVYRPDRPVATIAPGSSVGPDFVVQVIRPRMGLPLAGIVPPAWFGFEGHLGFDARSAGASVGAVGPDRLVLRAAGWDVELAGDGRGGVTDASAVVFELLFEGRVRRVRALPGDPAVGTLELAGTPGGGGFSGHFDIELARCLDAATGEDLGWPPQPFVLHGSFDRLRPGGG